MKRSTQHELFISRNLRPAMPIRVSQKPTSSSQRFAVAIGIVPSIAASFCTEHDDGSVTTCNCANWLLLHRRNHKQSAHPTYVSACQCSRSPQESAGLQPRETADPRLRILYSQRFIRDIAEIIELLGEHSDSYRFVDVFWETS